MVSAKIPLVSVVMITYNHEQYIEQAVNAILEQQGAFDIELIISNDNSTDGTDLVVQRILTENISSRFEIKYIHHSQNLGMSQNFLRSLQLSKGDFIALCEGDDYWCDKYKLKKQLSVFSKAKDLVLVCHSWYNLKNHGDKAIQSISPLLPSEPGGFYFGLSEFSKSWFTKTLTVMFRNNIIDFSTLPKYQYFRDKHLIYNLLSKGLGYFMRDPMGVYRVHQGGVFSMIGIEKRVEITYRVNKEIFEYDQNVFTRSMILQSLQNLIIFQLGKNDFSSALISYRKLLSQVRAISHLKYVIRPFVSKKDKKSFKKPNYLLKGD